MVKYDITILNTLNYWQLYLGGGGGGGGEMALFSNAAVSLSSPAVRDGVHSWPS